jgi:RNA polymerase sigma factor (sigma-70 family)
MNSGLRKTLDKLRRSLCPTGISDEQLLNRFIAERDEAAFAALVRRHGPMVQGVCSRILRNSHDSEDAFQATFLALVQKARFVANRQALASWLYTVAYRSALEVQIRNTRRQSRERRVAMRRPETKSPDPQDWRPVLDRELNGLPEKYRAPIILCDLNGLSRREAARQLHLAEGTLSSRLATGRRMLAERLSRHGVALSGGALALSLSEASASVPPSLIGLTTKSALLVAAGQTAAISARIALIMKGAAQAMFLAKLKPVIATVMALVLGTGTLTYFANGQSGAAGNPTASAKPSNEVAALRHENEGLKAALKVMRDKDDAAQVAQLLELAERAKERIKTLEKRIRELESEVASLKGFLEQQLNSPPAPPPKHLSAANKVQGKPKEPESIDAAMKRLAPLPGQLGKSKKSDAEVVEALCDAAVKRKPTDAERATMTNHIKGAKDRVGACRDVLWALVNSREFLKKYNLEHDLAGSLRLLNSLSEGWDQKPEADKASDKPAPIEVPEGAKEQIKALERKLRALEGDLAALKAKVIELLLHPPSDPAPGKSDEAHSDPGG